MTAETGGAIQVEIPAGWRVFPLAPKDKVPMPGSRGFHDASDDPEVIAAWWRSNPAANIGLATGRGSGVVVLDVDPRHGGHISLEIVEARYGKLPDTLICETGGGGLQYYFRHPGYTVRNTARLHGFDGLDVRGDGGYVVLPPSVHPSGGVYCWQDCEPGEIEIAEMPEWVSPTFIDPDHPTHTARSFVSFDTPAPEGERNDTAARLAGRVIAKGMSLAETLQMVREWNARNPVPLPDSEIETTVCSIARTHTERTGRVVPVAPAAVNGDDAEPYRSGAPSGAIVDLEAVDPDAGGVVLQTAEWLVSTARTPQPELAFANALALWAAAMGRKICTETDLRTNLYLLGVAPSGSGKEASRRGVKKLAMSAAAFDKVIGGEDIASDSALLAEVKSKPSVLYQIDEIGHWVGLANNRNAATHQRAILPTLTKLFSSANTVMAGKVYADTKHRPRVDIDQPCVSVYGTTVPGRLWASITPDDLGDGFFGRWLLFPAFDPDPDPIDNPVIGAPPDDLVGALAAWVTFDRHVRPTSKHDVGTPTSPRPVVCETTPAAHRVLDDFASKARARKNAERRAGSGLDAIWVRAYEHAAKVALVLAGACWTPDDDSAPVIEDRHADLAVRIVDFSTRYIAAHASMSVASNETERRNQEVFRVIAEAGVDGVSRTDLLRRLGGITAKQLDDIIDTQIEADRVAVRSEPTGKRGRPPIRYFATSGGGE